MSRESVEEQLSDIDRQLAAVRSAVEARKEELELMEMDDPEMPNALNEIGAMSGLMGDLSVRRMAVFQRLASGKED